MASSAKVLLNQLESHSIRKQRVFGREIILLKNEDFAKYKKFFEKSPNIFNRSQNYRTHGKFFHIHAVEGKEYSQVHHDYGNPSNALGAMVHFIVDVTPYFLYHLITLKKPYHF